MKRSLLVIRIVSSVNVAEISDLTILTETLVFACKVLLSLCLVFLLNLGTILLGETDERHTNRRPVELVFYPEGFGLEGYGDLEAYRKSGFLKSFIAYCSVEILFAFLVTPHLSAIWNSENTCGRISPDALMWEGGRKKQTKNTLTHAHGRRNTSGPPVPMDVKEESAESPSSTCPDHKSQIAYFNFGPALGPLSPKAKAPRRESARVFLTARRREVIAQRALLSLSALFSVLLLLLFLLVGLDDDFFPVRHKQFVLREYLVSSLVIVVFAVGVPVFGGLLQGVIVWLSVRVSFFDRLINAFPSTVLFVELTTRRHMSPGHTTVRDLDPAPTGDWKVPPLVGSGLREEEDGPQAVPAMIVVRGSTATETTEEARTMPQAGSEKRSRKGHEIQSEQAEDYHGSDDDNTMNVEGDDAIGGSVSSRGGANLKAGAEMGKRSESRRRLLSGN